MKKQLLLIFLVIISSALLSLEFKVADFKEDPFDHVNDVGKKVLDNNADACAVLRVETDIPEEIYITSPRVYKKEKKIGVSYFYISHRKRLIKFTAKGYMPVTHTLTKSLQKGVTYEVKIKASDEIIDNIPVTIQCEPSDANKIINDKNLGRGETFKLHSGKYTLKLVKEGYKTQEIPINVDANNALFKGYKLEQVELVSVQISSIPSDAEIFINEQSKGKTPKGLWLYPGEYDLKLSKDGYLNVLNKIEIKKGKEIFSYNLTKNKAYLNLRTIPTDAIIKLNGLEYKDKKVEVLPDEYTLEISKSGYLTRTEKINLKLGEKFNKSYKLKENVGFLNLKITPSDAKIFINKEDKKGEKKFKLAPATYQLKVEHKGYSSYTELINLKLDERIEKKIVLQGKLGTLLFNVEPLDANVSLYKDKKFIQKWQGMKQAKNLLEGEYEIVAKAKDYKTTTKKIKIKEDENLKINFVLKKLEKGNLKFNINFSNAKVSLYKKGKLITSWEGSKEIKKLEEGEYKIVAEKNGYSASYRVIFIKKGITKEVKITLKKPIDLDTVIGNLISIALLVFIGISALG